MAPKRKFTVAFKLEVLKHATENSGEQTARHFNIDARQVRAWKKQKNALVDAAKLISPRRARIQGGGRRPVSEEMEATLSCWIQERRKRYLRVSRRMIQVKATELFPEMSDCQGENFNASRGWLERFLKRNNFSLRKRTTMAQSDARHSISKIVNFITYVNHKIAEKKMKDSDVIAMDETACWFDMPGQTTVDTVGVKSVTLKTTGHEKCHVTVALAAKGDGTKLKPYIVFKGGIREVKAVAAECNDVVLATSKNGWMDDSLTTDWLAKVVGRRLFGSERLLVWDSYRCHISQATKTEMKTGYRMQMAVVPGGCTKYVQPADVSWNAGFKAHLKQSYDAWLAEEGNKTFTKGGNMRAADKRTISRIPIPGPVPARAFRGYPRCL
ncbi:hypothetical protein ACEWY4_003868 [Coilia grayii]|uniref:HTH CENPB-type domain-containing protein n=1 Tax=Coilia grayii TaxID=363190 RepID=A0ABD1KJZ2_9TELE